MVSWLHCQHPRSTFNILSFCLSPLVIAVFNVVHHDVPFPNSPRFRVHLGRCFGILVALLLPGVLVLTALAQYISARRFMKEMNAARNGRRPRSLPSVFTWSYWVEGWQPVVDASDTLEWTMTHAFFVIMHGFIAKSSTGQLAVLSQTDIRNLCSAKPSMRALFTSASIDDHSKAGAVQKAVFCWQLFVFAVSCVARLAGRLPLSLLEIATLAHSLCGMVAFVLWWHKPHGVDEAVDILIPDSLKHLVTWGTDSDMLSVSFGGIGLVLRFDRAKAVLCSLAVAALHGSPHLLALGVDFPTQAERRCWHLAVGIVMGAPLAMTVLIQRTPNFTTLFIFAFSTVYLLASCFIVAESFRQLFALPSGAFVVPDLVCYLPNFS